MRIRTDVMLWIILLIVIWAFVAVTFYVQGEIWTLRMKRDEATNKFIMDIEKMHTERLKEMPEILMNEYMEILEDLRKRSPESEYLPENRNRRDCDNPSDQDLPR